MTQSETREHDDAFGVSCIAAGMACMLVLHTA